MPLLLLSLLFTEGCVTSGELERRVGTMGPITDDIGVRTGERNGDGCDMT